MQVLKRVFSFILSGILILNLISITPLSVKAEAVYPDNWWNWLQTEGPWADANCRSGGCNAVSHAMMQVMAGVIEDPNYSPSDYISWGKSKGIIATNCFVERYAEAGDYTVAKGGKATAPITFIEREVVSGLEKPEIIKKVINYRKEGKLIIARVKGKDHFVLCGDPMNNDTDVNIFDPGKSKNTSLSNDDPDYVGVISQLLIYEPPSPVYPGNFGPDGTDSLSESTSSAEQELANEVASISENQANFRLNLNKYTQSEIETLAILKNKYMTTQDLACFKWNLIISQFAIPYVNNITSTLRENSWEQLYNIDSVSLNNAYYREKSSKLKSSLSDKMEDYLSYLKTNKSNLKSILKTLSDDEQYIYTPVITSTGEGASIYNLYNDDALYIKDNIALFGSDVEYSNSTNDNEAFLSVVQNTETSETLETSNEESTEVSEFEDTTQTAEETSTNSLLITSDTESVWEKMNSMKSQLDGSLEDILSEVQKSSVIQTTLIPVFINTDMTYAYNTIFVNNYLKYIADSESQYTMIEDFYNSYKNLQLYADQYGNIYYNNGTLLNKNYILVYPAYANPLYTSTELLEDDIAGVYYEDYNKILRDTSISITDENSYVKNDYNLVTDDTELTVTQSEVDSIVSKNSSEYNSLDRSLGIGLDLSEGSFQKHYLTNSQGKSTETLQYRRTNYTGSTKLDRPSLTSVYPYAKIDTTTNFIANKVILSMMNKNKGSDKATLSGGSTLVQEINDEDWYWDLATPLFYTNKNSSIDFESTTLAEIEEKEATKYSVNSSLSVESFNTHIIFKGKTITTQSPSNQFYNDNTKVQAGDYYVVQPKMTLSGGEDNQYISSTDNMYTLSYNNASLIVNNYKENSDKYIQSKYNIPIFTYVDGFKGMYNDDETILSGSFRKALMYKNISSKQNTTTTNSLSQMASTQGFSIATQDTLSTDYNAENYYLMNVIDSDRFNTYLTINTEFNNKNITGALPESIVYSFINSNPSTQYTLNNADFTDSALSIPVFSYTIDDTSAWQETSKDISVIRDIDISKLNNAGVLSATPYSLNKYYNSFTIINNNSGIKYITSAGSISSKLSDYPISDIILIAMIWDDYYLNIAPLSVKSETSQVTTGELYTDYDTIITPYNSLSEKNNNLLYYTKLTNNSLELGINFKPKTDYTVTDSYFYAKEKVFSVDYNVPNHLLSIYKNGYGDNLQRWVDNLKSTNQAQDVMDLIDEYTGHVVTGFKNFIISICQFLHNQLNARTNNSIFNITIVFDELVEKGFLKFLIVLQGISISVCLVKLCASYIFNKKQKIFALSVEIEKLFALSIVPVIVITVFSQSFKWINAYGFKYLNTKMVLNSVENYKKTNRTDYVDTSDILLEMFKSDINTMNEITLCFESDSDEETPSIEVSLQDIYKSVDYRTNLNSNGIANSFNGNQEYFKGLDNRNSFIWYNTKEFTPVNYNKYNATIFYYFYDWLKSQYLMYNAEKYSNYEIPNTETTEETYILNMQEAERNMKQNRGYFRIMYNDLSYIMVQSESGENLGISDILGLSNLFNLTDENGEMLCDITTLREWAEQETENYTNFYSDYTECLEGFNTDSEEPQSIELYNSYPLAQLITSDLWEKYEESLSEEVNHKNYLTIMPEYTDLTTTLGLNRIPNRVYGSLALLEQHTNSDKSRDSTKLEKKLDKINNDVYTMINTILNTYTDEEITDDGLIFTIALLATFEFNQELLGSNVEPLGLNNERINFDDILKAIYTTSNIDDNLFYNIYFSDNSSVRSLMLIIFMCLGEITTSLALMIRLFVYLLLILSVIIVSFYYVFVKKNSLDKIITGLMKQILILFIGQIILLSWINLALFGIHLSTTYFVELIFTVVFGILGVVFLGWYIISLKSLIKDIGNFGGNIIDSAIQTVTNTASGVKGKITTRLNEIKKTNIHGAINLEDKNTKINKNVLRNKKQTRSRNINKLKK